MACAAKYVALALGNLVGIFPVLISKPKVITHHACASEQKRLVNANTSSKSHRHLQIIALSPVVERTCLVRAIRWNVIMKPSFLMFSA